MQPLFPSSEGYNKAPADDEIEVTLIGPGFGECVLVHVGEGHWIVVDSCVEAKSQTPAALRYLADINVCPSKVSHLIITHWDADHCKGIAELAKACSKAKVVMSRAFVERDFLEFVQAHKKPLTRMARSGVGEIDHLLRELEKSGRTNIIAAQPDRRIHTWPASSIGHGQKCEIWTLAPSDFEYQNFLEWLASQMPKVGETRRTAITRKRNNLSAVIYLRIGEDAILLGGDIEERNKPEAGWSAILASSGRPQNPASLFNLSHHGADSGDHPKVWSDMLSAKPWALISSFRNGSVSLPSSADANRTLGYTENAYVSTNLKSVANPPMDKRVSKTIKQVTKRYTTLSQKMGLIRARRLAKGSPNWEVSLHGNASHLSHAR
ncbi:MBL fold metallo-hydrolase [Erythrobacter sp. GH1-10]|uniref:MBL fold metallo-hydrolase n=1 Tax=Erythrobacter sp. GH1-10 TaxID=3349334 RepID=UPI003878398D